MTPPTHSLVAVISLGLLLTGCGKGGDDTKVATTPTEAASQLEAAFAGAQPEIKASANTAAEALRTDDYDQAVVSLGVVRASPNVTLDQGLAIHSSIVNLEARLIGAMESGDANATRAYELLKSMKRK